MITVSVLVVLFCALYRDFLGQLWVQVAQLWQSFSIQLLKELMGTIKNGSFWRKNEIGADWTEALALRKLFFFTTIDTMILGIFFQLKSTRFLYLQFHLSPST